METMILILLACLLTSSFAFTGIVPVVTEHLHPSIKANGSHRNRRAIVVHDGKGNALRERIRSVDKTEKITMAMKLVAAAKVRRAQDAVVGNRPYMDELQSVFGGLVNRLEGVKLDLPLLTFRDVKKVTLCVVTGDRGLCGGYNSYIIKKTEARFEELASQGIEADLVLIGKKGISYFQRRDIPIRRTFETGQNPSGHQAHQISEELIHTFLSGESDAIELLYTKFESLLNSSPSVRTLIPFAASDVTQKGDEIFELTSNAGGLAVKRTELEVAEAMEFDNDMIFEQDPLQILNAMLPMYVNGQILRTLRESVASELAARMQAMQNASENAAELARQLRLEYNRGRQASVTQELLELVAGAAALK